MLASGPVHFHSSGCGDVYADLDRIVNPNFVFDDFSVESRGTKFSRHVIGGGFILGRARHMRGLRKDAQMLFGQFGIGYGEKTRFSGGLGGEIAKAEDGVKRSGRLRRLAADIGRQRGKQDDRRKKNW